MMLLPFFLEKRLFATHAFGQSWLIMFLMSSTLYFLVTSYAIDASCQNYKGNDITGDIEQIINEVRELASNAFARLLIKHKPTVNSLTKSLYGADNIHHGVLPYYFASIARLNSDADFVVLCGDSMVHLEPDRISHPPDPRGVWMEATHTWLALYDGFDPCEKSRKPELMHSKRNVQAFTFFSRLIYLCPEILDNPRGRSLVPYKDEDLTGERIDRYMLAPVVLLHELFHTHVSWYRKYSSRPQHHIII